MLPRISRWIVKSTIWLRPTLKSGSSAKLRNSARKPCGTTGICCLPSGAGVGIEPSTPTRKTEAPASDLIAWVQFVGAMDGMQGAEILRRSEEHTSELQSLAYLVCRLLLE